MVCGLVLVPVVNHVLNGLTVRIHSAAGHQGWAHPGHRYTGGVDGLIDRVACCADEADRTAGVAGCADRVGVSVDRVAKCVGYLRGRDLN